MFLFLKEELRGPVLVPGGATWTVPIPGGATWTCSCYWRRSCADLFLQCFEVGLAQQESIVKVLVFIAYELDKPSSNLKGPCAKYSCLHTGQAQ